MFKTLKEKYLRKLNLAKVVCHTAFMDAVTPTIKEEADKYPDIPSELIDLFLKVVSNTAFRKLDKPHILLVVSQFYRIIKNPDNLLDEAMLELKEMFD